MKMTFRCNLTSFSKHCLYQNNWLFPDTFSYMRGCPDSSRDLVLIWWACFQVEPFIFGLIRQLNWKSTLPYPNATETLRLFMSHLQPLPVINFWTLTGWEITIFNVLRFYGVNTYQSNLVDQDSTSAWQIIRNQISEYPKLYCKYLQRSRKSQCLKKVSYITDFSARKL